MARRLRCPKCGTQMMRGYMTFPICHKCHEHIVKCRYCQHYDSHSMECTSVLRDNPSVPDPDTPINCQFYSTSSRFEAKAYRQYRLSGAMVIVAALLMLSAIFGINYVVSQQSGAAGGAEISFNVSAPDQIEMSQPLNIAFNVSALPAGGSEDVILQMGKEALSAMQWQVGKEALSAFRWLGSTPQPVWIETTRRFIYLHYGPLPGGQSLQVVWSLAPERIGLHKMHVSVYSGGLRSGAVETISTTVVP